MATVNQYLYQVKDAIVHRSGEDLATLLTYKDGHLDNEKLFRDVSDYQVKQIVFKPWDELVICHLNVCQYIRQKNFLSSFKEQLNCVNVFHKIFQGLKDENWPLDVLYVISRDLRLLGVAADKVSHSKKPHENLEKATEQLMQIFRVCATDIRAPMEKTKKKGMITIINQLFKIYFRINKLILCRPLIRALENGDMMGSFPLHEKVTYNYFLGMKNLFDSDYKKAEELLSFSLKYCPVTSTKNRRLILIFLIPVKMLLGHMPSEAALSDFDLLQFLPLTKSIKEGNIRAFDAALEQESDFFWKYGIYLILEKLRVTLFRNIFKKVSLILNTHQIPIESFKVALEYLQGEPMDVEEVHCILANLIYENKIKGYISIPHQKLVISKQTPFPPLSSITN